MDLQEQQQSIDAMRRSASNQYRKDQSQDLQIQQLYEEISYLKMYVGSLCRLLIQKGQVTDEEIATVANTVYGAQPTPSNVMAQNPSSADPVDLMDQLKLDDEQR